MREREYCKFGGDTCVAFNHIARNIEGAMNSPAGDKVLSGLKRRAPFHFGGGGNFGSEGCNDVLRLQGVLRCSRALKTLMFRRLRSSPVPILLCRGKRRDAILKNMRQLSFRQPLPAPPSLSGCGTKREGRGGIGTWMMT